MKTKFKFLLGIMMLALTIGFTACEGDQGEIGPKGDTGAQGEPGVPGAQGPQGEAGGTEATSFGNVELTVSGVRPNEDFSDVIDFTEVIDYKYIVNSMPSSFVFGDSEEKQFYLLREFRVSAKENARTQDYYDLNTLAFSFSEIDGEIEVDFLHFSATLIDQNTMFMVGNEFESSELENDFEVTDYSYDETTGAVKFNFTYSYEEGDDTFEVSGKVNVTVYKGFAA